MNKKLKDLSSILLYIPMAGMTLFVLFYVLAALHYPGGSVFNSAQPGFSFIDNFLCDLLDDFAMNGEINSAKAYARASLGSLSFAVILLWLYIPRIFEAGFWLHILISLSGILSMVIIMFLSADTHDLVTYIAGAAGFTAILLTEYRLYLNHYYKEFIVGVISLLLVLANYYSYETGLLYDWLPLLQKFTFTCCIFWFLTLNVLLIKKLRY